MRHLTILLVMVILISPLYAQTQLLEQKLKGYVNPEEIVTISENTPFDKAIEVLSKVSEKLTGKRIVSTAGVTTPIGIEINKMPYMKALLTVVQYNNLQYEEKEDVIIVKKKINKVQNLTEDVYAPITGREVNISAVFFEANVAEMRERGINWEALFSKAGISVGSGLTSFQGTDQNATGGTQQKPPDFNITPNYDFNVGDFTGNISGVLKFFETNNLGELIAKPNVTVRDNMKGRIQIGSDISIKQRDFAGNVVEKFFSTGSIIEVTPHIYTEDGIDYVLLKVKVERSSFVPDAVTTVIKKTSAETELLMLNGEEAAIGGLFVNEEINNRRGIPILKDLPWWVFGIRYLTGYDQKQVTKKEIIIILKTDILPSLKERIANKKKENLIKKKILEDQKDLQKYQIKAFKEQKDEK